jgi:ArsR family transcriptional regulator
MDKEHYEVLAEQLKSLAHPDRIAILKLMCDSGFERMTVKSIYDELKMEQPIVSRHLSIMRKSGLLKRAQEKNATYYGLCMEKKSVNGLMKLIKSVF